MRCSKLSHTSARPGLRHLAVASVAAVALLVSACGSSSPAHHSTASTGSHGHADAKADVTLTTVTGYGKVLATSGGKALFLLTADSSSASKCTGKCAATWPPFEASGTPKAGAGVNGSLLSTLKRADGGEQVLYNGHPLYTHPGATPTAVTGSASDGGVWYLVSPSGNAITKTNGGGY